MDLKQSLQIRLYIDIILRKKVFIIAFLLLGMAVGLCLTIVLPKQYRASALLSYQRQKINPSKMSPDLQEKINEMVSTLTQLVTSRTDLEKMIKEFALYQEQRKKIPMEDVVDMMRKHILIRPSSRGDTFTIGFEGASPDKVVKVVNSLAGKFIEQNLKYREERATETSSYAQNELQMARVVLDKEEAAMRDYKLKYYNEMPDQKEANIARLNSLQQQYQAKQDSIQDLERTRVMLQEQITTRKNALTAESTAMNTESEKALAKGNVLAGESDVQRFVRLKRLYNTLLLKYTPKHPEVLRVHRMIEQLEKDPEIKKMGEGDARGNTDRSRIITEMDPLVSKLSLQMKKLEIDVDNLTKEKTQLKAIIEKYEKWVSDAPIREAEWTSLTREYGERKKHFDFLVSQDLQAQSALHIEQKQKGSQFRVEDPARLPEKPFSPNFYKVMGLSIFVSLFFGCGIALSEAFLDSSFKDVTDVENYLNIPVVCSIPYIYTEKENVRGKVASIVWFIVLGVSFLILSGAFLYFLEHGRIVL